MEKEGVTKTCLRIDTDLWKKFKIDCINQGCSANDKLTDLVEHHMKKVEDLNNGK